MTLPIQFELTDGQIRAFVNGSVNVSVTAPTLTDAVARLQTAVPHTSGTNGHGETTLLSVPHVQDEEVDPIHRFAGDLKDDPIYDEWIEGMRLWRERIEADPNW